MRMIIIMAALALLAGCARAPLPVDRPCGVLTDSLAGVDATTREGERRLAIHHARGRAAGCW